MFTYIFIGPKDVLNIDLLCSQLWLFQSTICLVFNICCWHLLSWFWCYNCSWHSELVDFTGNQPIGFPLDKFSPFFSWLELICSLVAWTWGLSISIPVLFSPLQIFNMQLWLLVARSLLKVQLWHDSSMLECPSICLILTLLFIFSHKKLWPFFRCFSCCGHTCCQ